MLCCKALDHCAERLDTGIQSKLTRIRRAALDAGERRDIDIRQGFTLSVAGWTLAAVLVIGLAVYWNGPGGHPAQGRNSNLKCGTTYRGRSL